MKKALFVAIVISAIAIIPSLLTHALTKEVKDEKAAHPDLTISNISIDKGKFTKSGKVTVHYLITNKGGLSTKPTKTLISVKGPSLKPIEINTPALKPGENFTSSVDYAIKQKGDFTIKATADYNNKLHEGDERNNARDVRFSIGF